MPTAHSANIRLKLEGLNNALQHNVHARLSTINTDEVTPDAHFQCRVDKTVRESLRALGYYSPIINFSFHPTINGKHDVLIIHINPGKPIKIQQVDIVLHGDAYQDSDYQKIIALGKSLLGKILNHGDYNSFKTNFSNMALQKGYFDAEFRKSQLAVSPSRYQAFWEIDFDSGKRYRFGKVRFHGAQICENYLQNLSKVHPGDVYNADTLAELHRRLAATNWFNSVIISPDFSHSKTNRILPLDAIVTPRTRNSLETSIGYSTDVGARIKTTWNKPWLNTHGQSLESNLSLSTPEQIVDLNYKIPLITDPLEQYYLLQGKFKREILNNIQSDSTILNVARHWDLSRDWQNTVNLRWSLDHFIPTNITNTTMLIYPGISITRTRQRGGLMASWGDNQRYSVDISHTTWHSDVNFIILQAQNIWIRTLGKKHRFVAHANLNWIKTNNFENVPPSLRFFAGGDRSIRGYKYKSLSPRDDDGKLTGASKLATGSLEYQYNLTRKWWGAIFIDAGEAVNNIKQSDFKIGTGIGVRWQSPVGPIKLDLSTPVADKYEHGPHFYVGLGPEL